MCRAVRVIFAQVEPACARIDHVSKYVCYVMKFERVSNESTGTSLVVNAAAHIVEPRACLNQERTIDA